MVCEIWHRGLNGLASNGPTYLKYMLGVDIKTNGMLSGDHFASNLQSPQKLGLVIQSK